MRKTKYLLLLILLVITATVFLTGFTAYAEPPQPTARFYLDRGMPLYREFTESGFTFPTVSERLIVDDREYTFIGWKREGEVTLGATPYKAGTVYNGAIGEGAVFYGVWQEVPTRRGGQLFTTTEFIIIIVVMVIVLSLILFCMYWFVVKKKTFTDLINVFRKKS